LASAASLRLSVEQLPAIAISFNGIERLFLARLLTSRFYFPFDQFK
jgi:hypothetical protein